MTYRDDLDAKREKAESVAAELRAVRREMNEIVALAQKERDLEVALARASREAGEARARVSLPLLSRVQIATPCHETFEEMPGNERVRSCARCEKNVYDLSAMTRDAAEALLQRHGQSLCVRFYRRADGTIMTADCAPQMGKRPAPYRAIGATIAAVAIAAGVAAIPSESARRRAPAAKLIQQADTQTTGEAAPTLFANEVPEPMMGGVLMGESVHDLRFDETGGVFRPRLPHLE